MGDDSDNMETMVAKMKAGVEASWKDVTAQTFMVEYLFCVGSIQKP